MTNTEVIPRKRNMGKVEKMGDRIDLYPTRAREEKIIDRIDPVVFGDGQSISPFAFTKKQIQSYIKDGFLVVPDAFQKSEIESLHEEYLRLENREDLKKRDEWIFEPGSSNVRSIFSPHIFNHMYEKLSHDPRLLDRVEQILGSKVYIHQARINIKRALDGKAYPWHSDFETWHAEDGMPKMRAVSVWIMLTDNTTRNGPLNLIRKSHKKFVICTGETPAENHRNSLRNQTYGVPSQETLDELIGGGDLVAVHGRAGTLVLQDCNIMHGSPDNTSTLTRTNLFFVFNSVKNTLASKPYATSDFRPEFLSSSNYSPLEAVENVDF
jgi:ectoine hydroxylase